MIVNGTILKKYSIVPYNFSTEETLNFADMSEYKWLRPILGEALYDEIQQQVLDDNLSDENSTLLTEGGAWRYLCHCIVYEAMPYNFAHLSEVGWTKGFSTNSEAISLKEASFLLSHLRSQIEVMKKYLIEWLQSHAESFELWEPDFSFCGCYNPVRTCCGDNAKLDNPEPLRQVYGFKRKNIELQ